MGSNEKTGESPPGESLYQARQEFILREVAGESLLVPTGEMAHKLNAAIVFTESAAILWKCLRQELQTKSGLADILVNEYKISPEQATEDVEFFLKKAVENELIIRIE